MDSMNRGNKSVFFLLFVTLMISSMFLTPSAINKEEEDNSTSISNVTNTELISPKKGEEFSNENSSERPFCFQAR